MLFRARVVSHQVPLPPTLLLPPAPSLRPFCPGTGRYHGGLNPLGSLSTLQEREAFYNGVFDLPVSNYDFVAPLGLSGAAHEVYHVLR